MAIAFNQGTGTASRGRTPSIILLLLGIIILHGDVTLRLVKLALAKAAARTAEGPVALVAIGLASR